MRERVDTRHRWLDILPALGVPVPIPAAQSVRNIRCTNSGIRRQSMVL